MLDRRMTSGSGGQANVEVESVAAGAKLERLSAEMGVENLHKKLAEGFDVNRRDSEALHVSGNGVEAKSDLRDDSQGAERSSHKFVEIIPGNVLDDLATGTSDGAVSKYDGHANDEVAKAAIPEAEASRVVGGSDPADCCAIVAREGRGQRTDRASQETIAWKTICNRP